jgi:hypothetical protein
VKLRTARPEERQLALLWLAAALSALALRPVWLAIAPRLPGCVFRSITGIPCPGCGSTRAASAMLQGDLAASLVSNPLAASAGLVFVVGAPLAALWVLARGPMVDISGTIPVWGRWLIAVVLLVNWIYLIAAG